jgi:DnaA family protein
MIAAMSTQLPLDVRLEDGASFDSFVAGENGLAVDCLRGLAQGSGESQALLWGASGSGKSHLLQAVCRVANHGGAPSAYMPLTSLAGLGPSLVEGLATRRVVCIDDTERVLGDSGWEEALFGLINEARGSGCRLVFAAGTAPAELPVTLADLRSRLLWGPVFRLEPPDDHDKLLILQHRAAARGFELPEESARYLLTRYPRDLRELLKLLNRIDIATLAAQRRATLPFIKSVLPPH